MERPAFGGTPFLMEQWERRVMYDRESIRHQLTEILETETDMRPPSMDDGLSLVEGLGLDSLDLSSLVLRIEDYYRIHLAQAEIREAKTVGLLLNLINRKAAELMPMRRAA